MRYFFGGALALALAAMSCAAAAQEARLRVAHQFPASSYIWVESGQVFVDAVGELTGGALRFDVFPAAQLGKDNVALVNSGLADVVALLPSYTPEKLALSSVAELPGLFDTGCEGTEMMWEIGKPGGPLDQSEYAPQGFRALFTVATTPYKIMLVSKQVSTLEDIAGLKIRAGGAAQDQTVRALGAVPISISGPELMDSVTRGTVDGAMFPYLALKPFSLDDKFDHSVEGVPFGTAVIIFAIRTAAWEALSDAHKAAALEAGDRARRHFCEYMDDEDRRVRDELVANGFGATTISGEEAARWQALVDRVAEDRAVEMDRQGRNGSALLEAMRAAATGN
ncbi:MAG TPA: TRAP transporter substrate-binding protein DctP [Amaricoccus sp.]|uniref:TRAP transporter substrate-binding protein DctP n=1 Tax=Amaricoccus sp. TaxID=1872485 RepID=UPI002C91D67E|nr:TRAP transporter substrate-binding protein DctP [Amaricoccus sp.]HMQ94098.1 TRAP transporter substrate-binding protein DctP [Amaricoccus sp.]HMR54387.1 TRAP transporter substrate-binding protein DctP [Amaricoccus sp.]HMU01399.1 TRAP transporter substrate-binding protein DctP [Amaricoccus sp.]